MVAVVGTIEGVVRPDMQAVRVAEELLPPAVDKAAVAIEDDHRVRAAVEQQHAVLPVHRDRGHVAELDLLRQLAPIRQGPIGPIALPENDVSLRRRINHRNSPPRTRCLTTPGMNSNLFWFSVDNGKSS